MKIMLHILYKFKEWYIKSDEIKHISSKFFYTYELQKSNKINFQQVKLNNNLTNMHIHKSIVWCNSQETHLFN